MTVPSGQAATSAKAATAAIPKARQTIFTYSFTF
jgi:hypothetical protein